ncbi:MAG: helix-turn-helix domain-containing protein [Actinomycetia bacterium]|nr:helix-turn-helix domain-containing protein [Actinomycetes bacterium]
MVVTLQALLAENGSKTAAAQRLSVERRTVYYRVDRITEILGRDLGNPETRLRLELAVRAWESLEAFDRYRYR